MLGDETCSSAHYRSHSIETINHKLIQENNPKMHLNSSTATKKISSWRRVRQVAQHLSQRGLTAMTAGIY